MSRSSKGSKDSYREDLVVRCEFCGHKIGYASKVGYSAFCSRCERNLKNEWLDEEDSE